MGKSGERRGLFRRRSTPPEQDPTIDLGSVLGAYGRTPEPRPEPASAAQPLDDDTVRYTGGEVLAEASDEPVVDLTEHAPVLAEVSPYAEAEAPEEPVVDLTEDAPAFTELSADAAAEPEISAEAEDVVPAPAGWWEGDAGRWDTTDRDQIDAVVHDDVLSGEADLAPEHLGHEEAYGVAGEHPEVVGPVEVAAWATVLDSPTEAHEEHVVDLTEPATETPTAAWWQALQTDDLGGLPVSGPEQHDEAHLTQHEHVDVAARLSVLEGRGDAAAETSASPATAWWAALQSSDDDVATEVVDVRDESLSEEPEAVAARLARLRDAGLLTDEEYAAEAHGLLADRS